MEIENLVLFGHMFHLTKDVDQGHSSKRKIFRLLFRIPKTPQTIFYTKVLPHIKKYLKQNQLNSNFSFPNHTLAKKYAV